MDATAGSKLREMPLDGKCDLMKKICFAIPYFGAWPRWFDIFLKTCSLNPSVNWLFYTDCPRPKDGPPNVRFVRGSFRSFSRLASEKLGLDLEIRSIRKLCDLKPAYGAIFQDYLKKYDFWGYGDIDVVYGDIRKFITDRMLDDYDVITSFVNHLAGHFVLFRNTPFFNRLYEQGPFKKVFEGDEWMNYAESGCIFHRPIHGEKPKCESMTHVVMRLAAEGKVRPLFRMMVKTDVKDVKTIFGKWGGKRRENWNVMWDRGTLMDCETGEELLYFHFRIVKRDSSFMVPAWRRVPDRFFMSRQGFSAACNERGPSSHFRFLQGRI